MSQRRSRDRQFKMCSLLWLGPVANEVLKEELHVVTFA